MTLFYPFRARQGLVPALPAKHVPRPRLIAALESAVEGNPLTLICAGPASGKTVLLTEWSRSRPRRLVWVSLDPADNSAAAFWPLVGEALLQAGHSPPVHPDDPMRSAEAEVMSRLESASGDPESPLVLILDDAHFVTDTGVVATLDALLTRPPQGLRVVLAARSDPLIRLHRFRIRGQLGELRSADLAMTASEIEALLATHRVSIGPESRALLAKRTEGWAAGVRLSALRMEGSPEPERFVNEFAIDRGSIGEYLVEEVLATLDQTTRRLLIRSSSCELVCGELADAVCESTGSGELLSRLAAANSFLSPVGHDGVWFRSHPLFREVLRHLLRGESAVVQQGIESRAARWHDGQGDLVDALQHALRASDWAYATDLLERGAFEQIFFHDGDRWVSELSAYPDAAPESTSPGLRHRLVAAQAAVACMLDRHDRARELMDDLEALGRSDSRSSLVDVARLTLAARSGDRDGVDAAVAALVSADPGGVFEAFALSELGAVHLWQMADGLAVETLERALALAMQLSLSAVALASGGRLVLAHCTAGRFSIAEKYALDAAGINSAHPRIPEASAAPFHVGTADLAASRGDLEGCAHAMALVDAARLRHRDPALSCAATLVQAAALQATCDYLGARATILSDPSCSLPGAWSLRAVSATVQLELVAQSGRPLVAIHGFQHGDAPTTDFLASRTHLARARAHLAAGDCAAAELMARRVVTASHPATTPLLVAAVIVESEVALATGDETSAVEHLTRAIDLSSQEEIRLPFMEPTPRFDALLSDHPSLAARWPVPMRSPASNRAEQLETRQHRSLPEPLTDRELSVLRWLATRMTTAEIATELFVSMNTVKTHLASIYRKLESSSRREAVARGRELHLI